MLIAYRPDIDGLRAVAIVPVVLFHAFPDALPGGFIGVDIFFVISGYLITRIILAELDHGRFSLAGFWGRRCRRILPALLFMLTVATGAGLVLLLPEDLKQYGAMLAATALFFANMQLAQDNGYFAPEFHDNPLLHTWSLAVEEQYYLLWPMLLLALSRGVRRKYLPLCILATIAASLAYSQWAVLTSPEQAFFGLPSRAFELLIGAGLAAIGPAFQPSRVLANGLAWTGAALIAAGFVLLSRATPFPGLAALVPCLGAACLIAAGNSGSTATLVGHALSSRAFVGIGKVSYSWYLWHWPPLAFAQYYFSRPLGFGETLALIGVGFIAAVFSWHFVETPFRDHRAGLAFRSRAAPALAVCMAAFLLLGGALFFTDGIISRLSPEAQAIRMAFLQEKGDDGGRARTAEAGTFGAVGNIQPSFLVWGDSHASHYMSAIADIAAAHGLKGLQLTTAGCQPSLAPQFDNTKPQRREPCRRVNQAAYALLRDRPEIRTVIVAGRWSSRYEPSTPAADLVKVETDIAATIDRLRGIGKQVVVMGEVPKLVNAPRSCVLKQLHLGVTIADCGFISRANLDPLGRLIWQSLKQMSERRTDVVFFAPQDYLCDAERCIALDAAGLPLYRDDDHLNSRGARFLMPFIETAIAPLVRPSSVLSQRGQADIVSAVPATSFAGTKR